MEKKVSSTKEKKMYVIYFRFDGLVYKVEAEFYTEAQKLWDKLSDCFEMVSTRP